MNIIAVSTLPMDFANLGVDLQRVSNADRLHVDVMDGRFVPEKTIWTEEVEMLKSTDFLKDIHLMIEEPEKHVEAFIEAGGDIITFHYEAAKDARKLVKKIHDKGAEACVAINPETSVEEIRDLVPLVDQVLVMSVHPGKGGQEFLDEALDKIKQLREMNDKLDIEVDGGINDQTGEKCVKAGANILCSGSYVFGDVDPKIKIDVLRNL